MGYELQKSGKLRGVTFAIFFARSLVLACCAVMVQDPRVSLLKWAPGTFGYWEYGAVMNTSEAMSMHEINGEAVYEVARHISTIYLVCNASYPVKWTYKHFDRTSMFCIRTRTYRETGEDIFDTSQYRFSATLELRTDFARTTGRYSCQSTASAKVHTDVYIYVPGMAPPYLVHAGRTMIVQSEDNITMVIPCIVSSSSTQVKLYKRDGYKYVLQPRSPYAVWNPQIGFTLKMSQGHDLFGDYKCVVTGEDEEDDYALFSAIPGTSARNSSNNILQGNASYSYEPILMAIKCCASGTKAPLMRIIFCDDTAACEIREAFVLERGGNGRPIKNSSCTAFQIDYRDTGVFRCKGEGIDVVRHFFSEPEGGWSKAMYFNWQEANPSSLISLQPRRRYFHRISQKIYANETLEMSCEISNYYYSEGARWALRWRNKTVQYLNDSHIEMDRFLIPISRTVMTYRIELVAHLDMEAIVCYAPIWNSTEWGNKTYPLNVYELSPPVIVGPELEEFRWSVNQTNATIYCPVKIEDPDSSIEWLKNGDRVLFEMDTTIREINGSSMTFTRVSHVTQGDYVCLIENAAGRANKTFRIFVDSDGLSKKSFLHFATSSWGSASIALAVAMFIAFLVGIGFLVWKLKLQKTIIDHFTRVVFRDASTEQSTETNGF